MRNLVHKHTDGINFYATFQVKANPVGKVVLSLMILILITVYIFVVSTITKNDLRAMLFPMILVFVLILLFPVRYLLWNLFGKETLIVNTKTISYRYDYGILRTNLKTISFDGLGTGFHVVRKENTMEYGKMLFYNYRKEDNVPQLIHQTSVLLDTIDCNEINLEISSLFMNDYNQNNGFIPYSEN
jgi:energy-coupling factor transporter transmembrane protein EcfT